MCTSRCWRGSPGELRRRRRRKHRVQSLLTRHEGSTVLGPRPTPEPSTTPYRAPPVVRRSRAASHINNDRSHTDVNTHGLGRDSPRSWSRLYIDFLVLLYRALLYRLCILVIYQSLPVFCLRFSQYHDTCGRVVFLGLQNTDRYILPVRVPAPEAAFHVPTCVYRYGAHAARPQVRITIAAEYRV